MHAGCICIITLLLWAVGGRGLLGRLGVLGASGYARHVHSLSLLCAALVMLALQALTGFKPNNSMCWLRWHVGNGEDVVPSGLSGVVQVTPGESHTCAISKGSMLNTETSSWLLAFIHNGCRAYRARCVCKR